MDFFAGIKTSGFFLLSWSRLSAVSFSVFFEWRLNNVPKIGGDAGPWDLAWGPKLRVKLAM